MSLVACTFAFTQGFEFTRSQKPEHRLKGSYIVFAILSKKSSFGEHSPC